MIDAAKLARSLNAHDVMRFLHDTQHLLVARSITAEQTEIALADVVTDGAQPELVFDIENGLCQAPGIIAATAHQMKSQPLRRFLSDSGKMFEFANEPREGFGKIRHLG